MSPQAHERLRVGPGCKHQQHAYNHHHDHHQPDDQSYPPATEVRIPILIQCYKQIQYDLQPGEEWSGTRSGSEHELETVIGRLHSITS